MPFWLQPLRASVAAHPDRAGRLKLHIEALEATITGEPDRCLERVRALFEAAFHSIGPHLGLTPIPGEEFPAQNRRIIQALDFALEGHPDAERIGTTIRRLLGSINGTISALAELSNIPGMRHGGSLDWRTLQRQHALMLGGLCDTLVSFLFDIAWNRAEDAAPDVELYDDFAAFNEWLNEEYGDVEVAGSVFPSSRVLYLLDITQYDAIRQEWDNENPEIAEEAA